MSLVVNSKILNDCFTVFLSGSVDSSNAMQMESEISNACEGKSFSSLELDLKDLKYISSAGLRVVLKLAKLYNHFEVVNASNEVFEIFDVTGFTSIVKVSKKLRTVSVEGCEMIGRGANGMVYRLDNDTIIKVYASSTPKDVIREEREYAQRAFLAGVPTAISFDMVNVADSYGIVFELVRADTLAQRINSDQIRYEWYANAYANLFKDIHKIEVKSNALPSTKSIYHGLIDKMEKWYSLDGVATMHKLIDIIPDRNTIVHNDFHTKNVMLQGDELLLIDMAEISCGHPIFDLGASYFVHKHTAENKPHLVPRFLGVDADTALNLWDIMVKVHFNTKDDEKVAYYNNLVKRMCFIKMALMPVLYFAADEDERQSFVDIGKNEVIAKADEVAAAIKELVEIVDKTL